MDPISILSALTSCYQYGNLLIEVCQHFRHAEVELKELVIRVEGSWTRTRHQLRFIERIAFILDDEHRRVQDDILGLLTIKLSLAQSSLDKVVKKTMGKQSYMSLSMIRHGKYVIQRTALNAVILDLEDWQRRFDPSWFLIMRIADPVVDRELAAQKAEQEQYIHSGDGSSSAERIGRAQSPLSLATNMRDALLARPQQGHQSIFLPVLETQRVDIPFSNAQAAQRGGQWLIIERYTCQTGRSLSAQNNDVRRLARKLASVNPWIFGLLNCKGVIKVVDKQRALIQSFDFVFRVPDSMEIIQSLRQNLLSGEMHHSLSRRILIAKELAKSVGYVHNLNFVHKHICPETILLFQDLESRFSTFLVGFDNFRAADGATNFAGGTYNVLFDLAPSPVSRASGTCPGCRHALEISKERKSAKLLRCAQRQEVGFLVPETNLGSQTIHLKHVLISLTDATWERDLYRHPSRQGEFPEEAYKMQHDVYSLGVCLLEIGLWQSFVSYSTDPKPRPQFGDAYQQFSKWLEGTGAINSPEMVNNPSLQGKIAAKLKDYFVDLAKTRLPLAMGDKYSGVVVTCLTCLDKDNENFGDEDEMSDEGGILVAVRFMETILQKLNEINV